MTKSSHKTIEATFEEYFTDLTPMAPEEVQAAVDDLYDELERRFGAGFADYIIKRYTDVKPRRSTP